MYHHTFYFTTAFKVRTEPSAILWRTMLTPLCGEAIMRPAKSYVSYTRHQRQHRQAVWQWGHAVVAQEDAADSYGSCSVGGESGHAYGRLVHRLDVGKIYLRRGSRQRAH